MKMPLQRRLFLYLLLLLFAFIVGQTLIYSGVEYASWLKHPEEPLLAEMEEVIQALILDLFLLPVLILLAWWISRLMVAPIQAIAATADRIGGGHFSERIETGQMPDDEMFHLADALNTAFSRYDAAVRRLQRFSGDASHQLRTPITAIRSIGEVALSRARDAVSYRETIETMLGELDRLALIVEQLLELSRLESGALRSMFERLDTGAVVEQAMQLYQPLCAEQGIELQGRIEPGISVFGRESLLVELVGNLLDNAIRHTPKGGVIRLEVVRQDAMAILSVHDSGPGIAPEFAQAIFERFTQIPGSRQGHAGLGLALASDIAVAHGGRLVLSNPGQPGACFECSLPLA